jgi:hypothetical protein
MTPTAVPRIERGSIRKLKPLQWKNLPVTSTVLRENRRQRDFSDCVKGGIVEQKQGVQHSGIIPGVLLLPKLR